MAKSVGADVPFFLDPRPSLMLGAGDTLEEAYTPTYDAPLVIVLPAEKGILTQAAYDQFDVAPEPPSSYEALASLFTSGEKTVQQVADLLFNNLAPAAKVLEPHVAEVEAWLKQQSGVLGAQVSGSGSSSFALCESQDAADAIADAAKAMGWRGYSTQCQL